MFLRREGNYLISSNSGSNLSRSVSTKANVVHYKKNTNYLYIN